MKLLYVCGTYVPASGGSEKSSHTLLRELVKKGHEIIVITGYGPGARKRKINIDNVTVIRIDRDELIRTLNNIKITFDPQVVLTQLIWSDLVLPWAKKNNLKTGFFVRSVGGKLKLSQDHPLSPDLVFSNSFNTQSFVKNEWDRDSIVIYPIVDPDDYLIVNKIPQYITMFNPIKIKGGEIFRGIAKNMPHKKFLAIEGWHQLKTKSMGGWDPDKMRAMANAYGERKMLIPEVVDLSGIKNITMVPAVDDVREIYKITRILLLPSLWEEASARVIREAMINGIPVIASDTGGTREIVGGGGVVIKDYLNIASWVRKIGMFDNLSYYRIFGGKARKEAQKFKFGLEVEKVEKALINLVKNNENSSHS